MISRFFKKVAVPLLICGSLLNHADALSVAWIKGNKDTFVAPTYGTGTTPSPTNTPGSRAASLTWVDEDDNMYLWGGVDKALSSTNEFCDMWFYNKVNNTWEWIHGPQVPVAASVFGVKGEFHPDNIPATRTFAATWVGSDGRLYMFGGNDNAGDSNSMWCFDPEIRQWSWIAGSDLPYEPSVYGSVGVFDAANVPGARTGNAYWKEGNLLYIFGGHGKDVNGDTGALNDIWAFDIQSRQWAFMKGSPTRGALGTYGIKGVESAANTPGGRFAAAFTTDNDGNLWLFGGSGFDSADSEEALQDLWKRNKATGNWTWISGDKLLDETNAFGYHSGIENFTATNTPPISVYSNLLIDKQNNLWLTGGASYQILFSGPTMGFLANVWKYDTSLNQWALMNEYPWGDNPTYGAAGEFSSNHRLGTRLYNSLNKFQDGTYFTFGGIRITQTFPPSADGNDNLFFVKFSELDITGSAGQIKTKYTNNPKKGESTTVKLKGTFQELSGKGLPATFGTVYIADSTDYPVLGNAISITPLKAIKEPKPGKTAKPGKFSVSLRYPGNLTGKYIAVRLDGGEMVDEKLERNNVVFFGPIAP